MYLRHQHTNAHFGIMLSGRVRTKPLVGFTLFLTLITVVAEASGYALHDLACSEIAKVLIYHLYIKSPKQLNLNNQNII